MVTKKVGIILWILLLVYISIVFHFTIIYRKLSDEYKMELMPFKTIVDISHVDYNSHGRYILREMLVNVGLLMPVGFLLGFTSTLLKKSICIQKIILLGFLISLSIETLQLITRTGTFEVDDLIYNTLGCAIGYLISMGMSMLRKKQYAKTKQK